MLDLVRVGHLAHCLFLRTGLVCFALCHLNPTIICRGRNANSAQNPRVVIVVTFFIYLRAGRTIYEKRKQLRDFHSSDADPMSVNGDNQYSVRTYEVTVTSEAINPAEAGPSPFGRHTAITAQPKASLEDDNNRAYSVHVNSQSAASAQALEEVELPIQGHEHAAAKADVKSGPQPISSFTTRPQPARGVPRQPNSNRRRNHELNNAAWSYTKCAILFFTAILITWIPSSANRVYSVIHKNEISIVLEFMSAFVLPLQGFWNAVIYAVTSWAACKNLLYDLRYGHQPDVTELVGGIPASRAGPAEYPSPSTSAGSSSRFSKSFLGSKPKARPAKPFDTESATELSTARTISPDGRSH